MYIKSNLTPDKIEKKMFIIRLVIIIIFFFIYFSFWNIQILRHNHYNNLAMGNITDILDIKAPRGIIVDTNNIVIAENKINFILLLNRKNTSNMTETLKNISEATGKNINLFKKIIKKYKHIPKTRTIPILKNLSIDDVIYIKSRPLKFKEFEIDVEPVRSYPQKSVASHIIGYVSEISDNELKNNSLSNYKLGDTIGKSGIEKKYEKYLKGIKGEKFVLKNNLGVIKKTLREKKPIIGNKIYLTIDMNLQKKIEDLLIEKKLKGAIGVVDLKTGGILSLISSPGFNPQSFWNIYSDSDKYILYPLLSIALSKISSYKSFKDYIVLSTAILIREKYLRDNYSLHNKFIQGRYSPGSTFKIIMSLSGLEEQVITKSSQIHCVGVTKIYNRAFHCWKEYGHGIVDLNKAITESCNIYFYKLGKKININTIAKYAGMLGLGKKTGIDIPNEINGLVPTDSFKFKNNRRWFPGDTISIAIGGGMLEVTPVQALLMISTVALRGQKPKLHLLDRIESNGKIIKKIEPVFETVPIKKEHFNTVIKGLYDVVNNKGTGRRAMVKGYDVCGKTGTQQIISKENPKYKQLVKIKRFKPHAWFVSFAPKDNPKYASVIFIENGGGAGSVAAPLAATIYKELFKQ